MEHYDSRTFRRSAGGLGRRREPPRLSWLRSDPRRYATNRPDRLTDLILVSPTEPGSSVRREVSLSLLSFRRQLLAKYRVERDFTEGRRAIVVPGTTETVSSLWCSALVVGQHTIDVSSTMDAAGRCLIWNLKQIDLEVLINAVVMCGSPLTP